MKKLNKRMECIENSIEAYANCYCGTCICSCTCVGDEYHPQAMSVGGQGAAAGDGARGYDYMG